MAWYMSDHSKSHQVCGSIKIRIILVTVSGFLHIILMIFLSFATWQQTGLSISSCFWYMKQERRRIHRRRRDRTKRNKSEGKREVGHNGFEFESTFLLYLYCFWLDVTPHRCTLVKVVIGCSGITYKIWGHDLK